MAKVVTKTIAVLRGSLPARALSGRSKTQAFTASAARKARGPGECSFFPLRTIMRRFKTASPGAIVGFCASACSGRILPAAVAANESAWRKRRQERGGTKSASGGDGLFTNPRIVARASVSRVFQLFCRRVGFCAAFCRPKSGKEQQSKTVFATFCHQKAAIPRVGKP